MIRPLPKGVEIKNGKYQYRHYISVSQRENTSIPHDSQGRTKRVILCATKATDSEFYSALAEARRYFEMQEDAEYLSLSWLYKKWTSHVPTGKMSGTRAYQGLEKSTQKRYDTASKILEYPVTDTVTKKKLGNLRADQITTPNLRKILDQRYLEGVGTSNLNNELAMLGSMFKFAKQYLPELGIHTSPTRGLEKFKTNTSTRYVTDEEYKIQYNIACQVSRSYLPDYMELTYLLAARGCEVSNLKIGAATDQGVVVTRTKGSLDTGIRWTKRLKEVWGKSLARHRSAQPDPRSNIIVNDKGESITK